jgi:hypothetical protein
MVELEPAITGRAPLFEVVGDGEEVVWPLVELALADVVVTMVCEVAEVVDVGDDVVGLPVLEEPARVVVGAYIKLDSVALNWPLIPWSVNLAEKPSQGTPLTW